MHALEETNLDTESLAHSGVVAVVRSLREAEVDPQDALRGAAYGAVEGAAEAGASLGEAALGAVEAAKEVAHRGHISEEVATSQALEGALEAAEALGPEAVAEVTDALPAELAAGSALEAGRGSSDTEEDVSQGDKR
jgi:hypothetical protein